MPGIPYGPDGKPIMQQIPSTGNGANPLQKAAHDPSGNLNPDGSPQGANVFAGSSYGADQNVGGTDVAGFLRDADPRDFMYGRDPNYAANTAAAERGVAATTQTQLVGQAANANLIGSAMGAHIADIGNTQSGQLGGMAQSAYGAGLDKVGRAAPIANYNPANAVYQGAQGYASQLGNMQQGPSAAQAQLQSGLNQAQASNLALARSGHGFGTSASALSQATNQNAAMGQQAVNASAQLSAQEQQAWNAQHAANLANAAGINTGIGGQLQQQGLTQAQLQAQATGQNDQAQASLMGLGIQGQQQAGAMQLQGATQGANTTQAGQTLDLQGTQAGMGAYTQGEQMAGINMSAQQAGDLNREGGLIQNRGIDAGLSVSNQNATNSAWGTGLTTAATIGAAAATAASDVTAKTQIQPLDGAKSAPGAAPSPDQSATPVQQPAKSSMVAPAMQLGGAVLGGAIGTAIAPGVGTAIGGAAGSALGNLAGHLLASDISTKDAIQPLGYGTINPAGSTQAGADNAFGDARGAAAKAESKAAFDADLHAQAQTAAANSMVGSAAQNIGQFGSNAQPFQTLGPALGTSQTMYGAQPSWGAMQPGIVQSDVHSKRHIEALHSENQALKAQLNYPPDAPPPSMMMLNQAAADQAAGTPGAQLSYPEFAPPPTQEQLNAAAAQQMGPGGVAMSDERAKADIERSAATDAIEAAPGYAYNYIEPDKHGYGRHYGPMAQDLASTPAGASTVQQMPDGKLGVNTPRLTLVNTAALHTHQQELKKLRADLDALAASKGGKDAKLSRELDAADAKYSRGLSGGAPMSAKDAALSQQLDAADAQYSQGLAGAAPMPVVASPYAQNGSYLVAQSGDAGINERYAPAPEAPAPHWYDVPNYAQPGQYVPFWQLPSAPYAPAQQIEERGKHLFGRG